MLRDVFFGVAKNHHGIRFHQDLSSEIPFLNVDGFFAQDTELAYLKPGFEATDFIRFCFEICLKKSKKNPGFLSKNPPEKHRQINVTQLHSSRQLQFPLPREKCLAGE